MVQKILNMFFLFFTKLELKGSATRDHCYSFQKWPELSVFFVLHINRCSPILHRMNLIRSKLKHKQNKTSSSNIFSVKFYSSVVAHRCLHANINISLMTWNKCSLDCSSLDFHTQDWLSSSKKLFQHYLLMTTAKQ